MPTVICKNCGSKTNTAVSDHIGCDKGATKFCYAKYEDGKWQRGCGVPKSLIEKRMIDSLLGEATS